MSMLIEKDQKISSDLKIVFVLGAPGSEKGTLCKKLEKDAEFNTIHSLPVAHLSVGDMLRQRKAEGALSPEQCRKTEDQELMGWQDILALMVEDFEKMGPGQHLVLIDGFPRNLDQLEAFESRLGNIGLVVSLQCPREVALQRYLGRHDPTRPDGDEQLFSKRFAEFEARNPKILDHYKQGSSRVIEVDVGSMKGVYHNYAALKEALGAFHRGPWCERS